MKISNNVVMHTKNTLTNFPIMANLNDVAIILYSLINNNMGITLQINILSDG